MGRICLLTLPIAFLAAGSALAAPKDKSADTTYPVIITAPYQAGHTAADDLCAGAVGDPVCNEEASAATATGEIASLAEIVDGPLGSEGTAEASAALLQTISIPRAFRDQAFTVTVEMSVHNADSALWGDCSKSVAGGITDALNPAEFNADVELWASIRGTTGSARQGVYVCGSATGPRSFTFTLGPSVQVKWLTVEAGIHSRASLGNALVPAVQRRTQAGGAVQITRIVIEPVR